MTVKKQKHNWLIDVVLFIGYLACFYLEATGIVLHQWLGTGLTLLGIIHLMIHWDWVKAIAKRLFSRAQNRNRWYFAIDVLLMLGFVVILETGLVISTWFNLALSNYPVWLDVHLYSSFITLGLVLIKIGMHWRWVVNTTTKLFEVPEKRILVPVGALKSAMVPIVHDEDRRRFLAMMGIVGFSSVIAILNVTVNRKLETAQAKAAADESQQPSITQTNGEAQANLEKASSNSPAPAQTFQAGTGTTATPMATATTAPSAGCIVRCDRGCSFPGSCRRYTDQNNNQRCDLGECL